MDKSKDNKLNGIKASNADSMKVYKGPERRNERRRDLKCDRIERLLKSFGLEQRLKTNRRQSDTSWLVTPNSFKS